MSKKFRVNITMATGTEATGEIDEKTVAKLEAYFTEPVDINFMGFVKVNDSYINLRQVEILRIKEIEDDK